MPTVTGSPKRTVQFTVGIPYGMVIQSRFPGKSHPYFDKKVRNTGGVHFSYVPIFVIISKTMLKCRMSLFIAGY